MNRSWKLAVALRSDLRPHTRSGGYAADSIVRCAVTLAITTMVTLVIGGCQSDIGPSPGLADPYPSPYHDPQISVLSPELQEWVRFHPALIRANGEQPLRVSIPARNLGDRQYLIQYRFIYRNKEGFELEPKMGWHRVALGPKSTVDLTGAALSLDAVSYKLEVRWAQ